MTITAEVILDSTSPAGIRLTTMRLRYPKFIHGEFMTHRVFSRNASSSRAIPTAKLLEEVRSNELRAAPVHWGKNQPGMGADEELHSYDQMNESTYFYSKAWARDEWAKAAHAAANFAEVLWNDGKGAHKQIVNRILEPFTHINVLVTATEWDNFFGLRLDRAAQPEMRALAEAIWVAWQMSDSLPLEGGQWHLPFVGYALGPDTHDDLLVVPPEGGTIVKWSSLEIATKVSVARCARVSYQSFETGKCSTVEEDIKLYDRLLGSRPIHASPAEHQATPDNYKPNPAFHPIPKKDIDRAKGNAGYGWNNTLVWCHPNEHGNFVGWRQYRKTLEGEAVAPLPDEYNK